VTKGKNDGRRENGKMRERKERMNGSSLSQQINDDDSDVILPEKMKGKEKRRFRPHIPYPHDMSYTKNQL
jgi:hypothetical protein